jgi:hypothetical protein
MKNVCERDFSGEESLSGSAIALINKYESSITSSVCLPGKRSTLAFIWKKCNINLLKIRMYTYVYTYTILQYSTIVPKGTKVHHKKPLVHSSMRGS